MIFARSQKFGSKLRNGQAWAARPSLIDRANFGVTSEGNESRNENQDEKNKEKPFESATSKTGATILWVCDKCTFQSRNEDVLKEHKKVYNEGWKLPTIYICDLCETSCNSQIEFKKHADELHREKNATNVIISVKVNYF